MRRLLSFVMLLTSLGAMAQPKERRVYYLDCSFSMQAPNKIWDPVRNDLIKAIRNVNDETTELVIVPFSDDKHPHAPKIALATQNGKDSLIGFIQSYKVHTKCFTYHSIPLNDFEHRDISQTRRTYMFLMTDGQDEDASNRFNEEISHWGERYGDREVYGFYVILSADAKNPKRQAIIDRQRHLWWVESADVNINVISLETKARFNAKTEKYVELKVMGDLTDVNLTAALEGSQLYQIDRSELLKDNASTGRLRVFISPKQATGALPEETSTLKIEKQGGDKFTFLVTDAVALTCEHKKERSLKISIR